MSPIAPLPVVRAVVVVLAAAAVVVELGQPVACASWWQSALGMGKPAGKGGAQFQADYDAINRLLVKKEPSDAPLENLLEAVKWSKQLIGEQEVSREDKSELQSISLDALIQFSSLLKLMDVDSLECGLLSYEILRKNEKSTGNTLMVAPDQLGPTRRIEDVIRQVAVGHAEQCRYEYPKLLKWTQEDAPKRSLDDIRRMMNKIIETSQRRIFQNEDRETDPRQLLRQKAETISMAGRQEAQAMLVYLRHRARDDPDVRYLSRLSDPVKRGKWVVVGEKVHELLEKYAFSRCEYLMRAFGHILRPAEYEQRLSPPGNRYRAINNENAELIIQMEYYRLCDDLLKNNKNNMEKNVIRAIWDETK